MGDAAEPSRLKRSIRAIGTAVAVPLRIADFVFGIPQSTQDTSTVRELRGLAAMRERGELTEDEYRRAKDKLLGGS